MKELITEIAAIPTISSGQFISNELDSFELNLNIRKYCGNITKKTGYLWRGSGPIMELNPDIKFRSLSPDGSILLIGRTTGENDCFIEIWSKGGKCFVASINAKEFIEDFCCDEVFGSFSWSESGGKFSFIGEKKKDLLKDEEFYKFAEVENFGERLQTVKEPVLCVLTIATHKLEVIEINWPEEIQGLIRYPAQPVFINEDSLIFMGIDVGSKKLGMTYIYCRPTAIYLLSLSSKQAKRLSNSQMSARSPIVSKDGRIVVYLQNTLGRSHFKASELIELNLETGAQNTIIKVVQDPKAGFPGIFCQRLPAQRFTETIYFTGCWYDLRPIVKVNLSTKHVEKIMPEFVGSSRILDIRNGKLLITSSTATNPGIISIFDCQNGTMKNEKVDCFDENIIIRKLDTELVSSILELNSKVHVVLLKPKTTVKLPLIVVPHGGPNSVCSVDYDFYPVLFAKLGYAVASINYTGSIGFGDESIEALEGQIGVRDVEDCYLSVQMLLGSLEFDEKRVIVMGGSHGGYLTAHLSAKYPDLFKGAILINPVIDLPSMTVTSDIADWTFGQLGINVDQLRNRGITEQEMRLFHERSPSKYAHQVKCPTLMMLGSLDLRVPPSQGRYWANLLRGNDVDCQVVVFPDANHGLETGESERFGLQAILAYFQKIGF